MNTYSWLNRKSTAGSFHLVNEQPVGPTNVAKDIEKCKPKKMFAEFVKSHLVKVLNLPAFLFTIKNSQYCFVLRYIGGAKSRPESVVKWTI